MRLSVKFDGQLVRRGLQDLSAEIPKIGRQPIRAMMERVKRKMQAYPDEPAGQSVVVRHNVLGKTYRRARGRYERTGNLGASWAITEIEGGYAIENTAAHRGRKYGRYVVGDAYGAGQAWMHQGRWQVLRDVVDDEAKTLPPEIDRLIVMVARRNGL